MPESKKGNEVGIKGLEGFAFQQKLHFLTAI
jgi:hypothetical protein